MANNIPSAPVTNNDKYTDDPDYFVTKIAATATTEPKLAGRSTLEEDELKIKKKYQLKWKYWTSSWKNAIANILVFICYLISLDTILACAATVGLTMYWRRIHLNNEDADEWKGGGMDWILLGFAVVTPITVTIGLQFRRREKALYEICRVRSFAFQIYLSHAIWDWPGKVDGSEFSSGRAEAGINWREHTDDVLEQLIGIGDELGRFLTLPTSSRSVHRVLGSGRKEASEIVEVGYRLFDSLYTQRITNLSLLTEKFKALGLASGEVSRIRQYERFIGEAVEGLRMIKMYRTPQALRSFGRIFTVIIPPFYAPTFAQLSFDLDSVTVAIAFAILTPLCLTALFQSTQSIEDPFVGFVTLDGINVKEEFEVLLWNQLCNARRTLFPYANDFDENPTEAIDKWTQVVGVESNRRKIFDRRKAPSTRKKENEASTRVSHFALNGSIFEPRDSFA